MAWWWAPGRELCFFCEGELGDARILNFLPTKLLSPPNSSPLPSADLPYSPLRREQHGRRPSGGEDAKQEWHLVLDHKLFLLPTLTSTTSPRSLSAPTSSTPSNPMAWRRCSSRWPADDALLAGTRARIDEEVRKFDRKIADAKENLGEIEVCEADLAKSLVLHKGRGEGKLICMLGVCMKCMAMHPEASAVAPAVLDMIRSSFLQIDSAAPMECLISSYRRNLDISTGLELILIWALHVAEVDPDTECMLNNRRIPLTNFIKIGGFKYKLQRFDRRLSRAGSVLKPPG